MLCVLLTYGGGSAVVQGIAWVTMIPSQVLSTGSLEDGIKNTFDGEHACSLCALASELRENKEVPASVPDKPEKGKKLDTKEKTAFQLMTVKQIMANSSLVLLRKESRCCILRTQLDVEVPPPDYV